MYVYHAMVNIILSIWLKVTYHNVAVMTSDWYAPNPPRSGLQIVAVVRVVRGPLPGVTYLHGLTSGFTLQSISEGAHLEHRRAAQESEQHGCWPPSAFQSEVTSS